ncbi:MAG: type II toxin-antitoxin system RelE/ParE family toxin [Flavobacteriales bacterium]|nr:type II toxin-antitoxin system RelE/ParE family toxin [Flavobacteriales bacterium]
MSHTLVVQPEAEDDAASIADELDEITPGLGDRFFDALDDLYIYIEQFPFGFQKRYKDYRHGYLRHFPYRVVYLVEGKRSTSIRYGTRAGAWIRSSGRKRLSSK